MRFMLLVKAGPESVKERAAMGKYKEELIRAGVMLDDDAGYWIIQARTEEEAVEWARRAPFAEGEIEVRQLSEPGDFQQ